MDSAQKRQVLALLNDNGANSHVISLHTCSTLHQKSRVSALDPFRRNTSPVECRHKNVALSFPRAILKLSRPSWGNVLGPCMVCGRPTCWLSSLTVLTQCIVSIVILIVRVELYSCNLNITFLQAKETWRISHEFELFMLYKSFTSWKSNIHTVGQWSEGGLKLY